MKSFSSIVSNFCRRIPPVFVVYLLVLVLFVVPRPGQAQTPLSNLVFTVGTTIQNNGTNWSYLLIGSENPSLLAGKQFGVYRKTGLPTDPGTYSPRATLYQHNDPASINALLTQSVVLRDNLTTLSNAMNVVLHNVFGATNFTLPQKFATAFSAAVTDPGMAQTIALLAHGHPGLSLCLGQAYSEPIASVTTYEVREINPADGSAGEVIGRVTITPGSPVTLPAPGFPFQITTNSPMDDLRIRLRWGTPPELRRLALLGCGYNLWRMPALQAVQMGFDVAPPMLNQLYANAVAVNDAPAFTTKDFSASHGPGGADDSADTTTYFFADDNGHKYGQPAFNDGDQFYYFVTARDLLGRDGLVSPGALATACRQNIPSAPTRLRVENSIKTIPVAGGFNKDQRLELWWQQNTNLSDQVSNYWIYRWDNPSEVLTNDSAPLSNLIGIVPHIPGTNLNSYIDNGTNNSPTAAGATNFWYTIRAVSQSACGPLLSPHSAPVWGVLRERTAPDAPGGELLGSCGIPVVMFTNFNTLADASNTNGLTYNYRLTCIRRDRSIAWVQFTGTGFFYQATLGPIYFPPDADSVSVAFNAPFGYNSSQGSSAPFNWSFDFTCVIGDFYGTTSRVATVTYTNLVTTNTAEEVQFFAGELLLTALDSNDPLLTYLDNNQPYCASAEGVTPYPDGTVGMDFRSSGLTTVPMAIQVYSNSVWLNIATAWPDTNGEYWVSYPACLLGPLPQFRGCALFLDNPPNCDQHIARAANDGPVAPIDIRFRPTPRTHEYRVFRRANGGPLSLIAQGATVYNPANPSRAVMVTDDAMPPSTTELCYFVQALDENGNGSPLSFIGCKTVKPPVLPTPVLAEPIAVGDTNNPEVLLNWFCPTAGVHRFEIQIERADQPGSGKPSGFGSLRLLKMPFFNSFHYYAGLVPHSLALSHFDEGYLTPPIGINFGPGPQFNTTASVLANVPYNITVASVGDTDEAHVPSQVWKFTWQPTNALPTVPWPARPLPPVTYFDETNSAYHRVSAVILRTPGTVVNLNNIFPGQLDTKYPVGIRIGDGTLLEYNNSMPLTVGTNTFVTYIANGGSTRPKPYYWADPVGLTFHRVSNNPDHSGQSLLPIVVYRQQVANGVFPKVSGSLVQVTPLIERIPYSLYVNADITQVTIPDLLIAAGSETPISDTPFSDAEALLYVRDLQPVMVGATYQYFVMRLNNKHEVAEIIDAGTVTIPAN